MPHKLTSERHFEFRDSEIVGKRQLTGACHTGESASTPKARITPLIARARSTPAP